MTLGMVYLGVAFPILWKILDKRGMSNTVERVEFILIFMSFQLFAVLCPALTAILGLETFVIKVQN